MPFVYILSVAIFGQQQSSVIETKTIWFVEPKYLLSGSFQKKFTDPREEA